MSFFGDIVGGLEDAGGAIVGALKGAVSVVSDIANSTVGQLALDIAGSFGGDPQLGAQVAQYAGTAKQVLNLIAPDAKKVPTKTLAGTALTIARLHAAGVTLSHYVRPKDGAGFLLYRRGGKVIGAKPLGIDRRWAAAVAARKFAIDAEAARAAAAQKQLDKDMGYGRGAPPPGGGWVAPGGPPQQDPDPDPTFPPVDGGSGRSGPIHVVDP